MFALRILATVSTAALVHAGPSLAAQHLHKTVFDVQFGAIAVGSATFEIEFDSKSYALKASGKTVGVAELFASGRGVAQSKGRLDVDKVMPESNFVEYVEKKKTSTVQMAFARDAAPTVEMVPDKRKPKVAPKYVPIEVEHLLSVIDPASSIVVPVAREKANDPQSVCNRTLPIYDGDTRFDIALRYKATKPVETEGYKGYAYVCQLRYQPVSGHKTKHRSVEAMSKNKDMEIWLAPMDQTNIFSPIRIVVPTWAGTVTAVPAYFGPAGG
jgi:hypothetical protein